MVAMNGRERMDPAGRRECSRLKSVWGRAALFAAIGVRWKGDPIAVHTSEPVDGRWVGQAQQLWISGPLGQICHEANVALIAYSLASSAAITPSASSSWSYSSPTVTLMSEPVNANGAA